MDYTAFKLAGDIYLERKTETKVVMVETQRLVIIWKRCTHTCTSCNCLKRDRRWLSHSCWGVIVWLSTLIFHIHSCAQCQKFQSFFKISPDSRHYIQQSNNLNRRSHTSVKPAYLVRINSHKVVFQYANQLNRIRTNSI